MERGKEEMRGGGWMLMPTLPILERSLWGGGRNMHVGSHGKDRTLRRGAGWQKAPSWEEEEGTLKKKSCENMTV